MIWLVLASDGNSALAHDETSALAAVGDLLQLVEDKKVTITFLPMPAEKPECNCGRRTCRCFCPRCWSKNLMWEACGSYLDKDLICKNCGKVVDIWDC